MLLLEFLSVCLSVCLRVCLYVRSGGKDGEEGGLEEGGKIEATARSSLVELAYSLITLNLDAMHKFTRV